MPKLIFWRAYEIPVVRPQTRHQKHALLWSNLAWNVLFLAVVLFHHCLDCCILFFYVLIPKCVKWFLVSPLRFPGHLDYHYSGFIGICLLFLLCLFGFCGILPLFLHLHWYCHMSFIYDRFEGLFSSGYRVTLPVADCPCCPWWVWWSRVFVWALDSEKNLCHGTLLVGGRVEFLVDG